MAGKEKASGRKAKRNKKKCELYRARGKRERNKKRRIDKDARRAKPMACGHGSRHRSKYDGECRRCHARSVHKRNAKAKA